MCKDRDWSMHGLLICQVVCYWWVYRLCDGGDGGR